MRPELAAIGEIKNIIIIKNIKKYIRDWKHTELFFIKEN